MASGPACCRSDTGFAAMDPEAIPSVSRFAGHHVGGLLRTSMKMDALPGMPRRYRPTAVSSRCRTIWEQGDGSRALPDRRGAMASPFDEQGRETDLFNRVSRVGRETATSPDRVSRLSIHPEELARSYRLDHRRYPFASP